MKNMRWFAVLAAVAVTAISFFGAKAAEFPSRAITMIIPFPPGGGTDQIMRVIGQEVSKNTGQPFIVLNRGGAGGSIAAMAAKNAAPDGYTLFFGNMGTQAVNSHIMKIEYDPKVDFAPITLVMVFPHVLVVPAASPARTVAELVSFANAKKGGGASFATQGMGSGGQLLGEMLRQQTGAAMTAIAYQGGGPAIIDTLANRDDFMFSSYAPVAQFVENGKLRVLAVTGEKRLSSLPNVPTLAEAGLQNVNLNYWFAVFAPAGAPRAIIDKLNAEFRKAAQSASVRRVAEASGANLVMSSPEELSRLVDSDAIKLGEILRKAGFKPRSPLPPQRIE